MAALRLAGLKPHLLAPIDLEIGAGELVFISGPSGAGKSLLLRAIADLDPSAGEVLVDARPRALIPAPDWRRRVGLLPADSGWWAERVGAHFVTPSTDPAVASAFAMGKAPQTLAHEASSAVVDAEGADQRGPRPRARNSGLGDEGSALAPLLARLGFAPDVLDWEVGRLSTGERQRLALARLLYNGPEVLLLDEATANLDPSNRTQAEQLIDDYRRQRRAAVLWVSHDPEQRQRLARAASGRCFLVEAGRLQPDASIAHLDRAS
jgi:ABC-type iron transport system FetAB ATPase subunit